MLALAEVDLGQVSSEASWSTAGSVPTGDDGRYAFQPIAIAREDRGENLLSSLERSEYVHLPALVSEHNGCHKAQRQEHYVGASGGPRRKTNHVDY